MFDLVSSFGEQWAQVIVWKKCVTRCLEENPSLAFALSLLFGAVYYAWRRREQVCPSWYGSRQTSLRDSAGSLVLPPHYSRCNSFRRAPPPYHEVTTKPDMYPLVITYGESGDKSGGNYLMVHYFRNYIIRPSRSISATSTADSLNSSFMCNVTNEANTMVPPPYSAENLDQWREPGAGEACVCRAREASRDEGRVAMPRSISTMTYLPSRGHTPIPPQPSQGTTYTRSGVPSRYQPESPENLDNRTFRASLIQTASRVAMELENERCFYAKPGVVMSDRGYDASSESPECHNDSPVSFWEPTCSPDTSNRDNDLEQLRTRICSLNATSPTQDTPSQKLSDPEVIVKNCTHSKDGLYMPLSGAVPVHRSQTRLPSSSAPTTPCGSGLIPTLLSLSQRVSGSVRGSRTLRPTREESNPLLERDEPRHTASS